MASNEKNLDITGAHEFRGRAPFLGELNCANIVFVNELGKDVTSN